MSEQLIISFTEQSFSYQNGLGNVWGGRTTWNFLKFDGTNVYGSNNKSAWTLLTQLPQTAQQISDNLTISQNTFDND